VTYAETFNFWLWRHGFTPEFVEEVVVPLSEILFISGRTSLYKPAKQMVTLLCAWLGLDPESRLNLWRVQGGNHRIIEHLIRVNSLHSSVHLGTAVGSVTVDEDGKVTTTFNGSSCVRSRSVIFTTNARATYTMYENPNLLESILLRYFSTRSEVSYGIPHKNVTAVREGVPVQC
jgi:predicted NAD/FAD-binding protein